MVVVVVVDDVVISGLVSAVGTALVVDIWLFALDCDVVVVEVVDVLVEGVVDCHCCCCHCWRNSRCLNLRGCD